MQIKKIICLSFVFVLGISSAVLAAGWDPDDKEEFKPSLEIKAEMTTDKFLEKDPDLKRFFDSAYGYVVFPTVGKGGAGIGGAYGKGIVYEQSKVIGSASLKQVSYGFQFGGQSYSEIIFFKNKAALDTFIEGNYEFGAGISAVAITLGASAQTDYSKGVAVFTMTKGGLMYEATISGQKFKFTRLE